MLGLTGAIGSGKSTVARLLAERGAFVVDTDVLARQAVEPGGSVHDAVVARFGSSDRSELAGVVFSDPAARADLEALVHPAVAAVVGEELARLAASAAAVVVLEIPLLVEAGWASKVDRVVVVDVPDSVAVTRAVAAGRGLSEDDVRGRLAAQASREERLAVADHVIVNKASLDDLRAAVDRLWAEVAEMVT